MPVLVIVGLARSGKDTAADYISQKYGYTKYTFSSVLGEMLLEMKKEPSKENMIALGDKLRAEKGMDVLAQLLDMKIGQKDKILLVGPRSIEEVEYFRKKFPSLKIVKVTAEKEARFKRKSKFDPKTESEFFGRDSKDIASKGMQKVLDAAQHEIKNDGDKATLYAKIDGLIPRL